MKIKQLLTEDRAVSPVIGVILMVAITVILAAVIGTFVLGLGENVQSTPQAKFTFDYQDDDLTVTHDGGDALSPEELSVASSVAYDHYDQGAGDWAGEENNSSATFAEMNYSSDVTAGTSVRLAPDTDESFDSSTVRVVWSDTDTDKSATLGRWDGPEA